MAYPLGDSIVVAVTYGASPRLTLTYLNTYASNTGCVRVYAVPLSNNAVVQQALLMVSQNGLRSPASDAVLANLSWDEINWMDAKRPSNDEFEKLSLTMIHTFYPEPAQYSARSFQYGTLAPPHLFVPNSTYLVKITQMDANAEAISKTNERQGRGGHRTPPQKFKLYSISSC